MSAFSFLHRGPVFAPFRRMCDASAYFGPKMASRKPALTRVEEPAAGEARRRAAGSETGEKTAASTGARRMVSRDWDFMMFCYLFGECVMLGLRCAGWPAARLVTAGDCALSKIRDGARSNGPERRNPSRR